MANPVPTIIGTGELQKNASLVIKKIAVSHGDSFIVTNNEPKIVMMSISRYRELKALEDIEFIPHRKSSPKLIRKSFEKTGLYSKDFLDDMEDGLSKSSLYS